MIASIFRPAAASGVALILAAALAGCGGVATNRGVTSIHQPVIERTRFAIDVEAGPAGISDADLRRLAGWFAALRVGYGDRVAIDDGSGGGEARAEVAALLSRHGLVLDGRDSAARGAVSAGALRIVVMRAKARVPGCPDWSANADSNPNNATSSNYGCAINGNLAAMVADPEQLLEGAEPDGAGRIAGAGKAIAAWRDAPPSGAAGLRHSPTSSVSSTGGGN